MTLNLWGWSECNIWIGVLMEWVWTRISGFTGGMCCYVSYKYFLRNIQFISLSVSLLRRILDWRGYRVLATHLGHVVEIMSHGILGLFYLVQSLGNLGESSFKVRNTLYCLGICLSSIGVVIRWLEVSLSFLQIEILHLLQTMSIRAFRV